MTKNKAIFDKYAALGKKLVNLHLLNDLLVDTSIKVSLGCVKGEFIIEKLEFANGKICLSVSPANKTSDGGLITLEGIPPAVFYFEIGSRKPIDLWLKNRMKDKVPLGFDDLYHIKNMIIAIKQTISIMEKVERLGEEYLHDV